MGLYIESFGLPKERPKYLKIYPDGTIVEKTSSFGETIYRKPAIEIDMPKKGGDNESTSD